MSEAVDPRRWRPTPTSLAAGALVIAGFALTGVSWWFFILTGLGALGPGIARELGWLRDKDEFQRRADHRAGYHAFLATGVLAFLFVAYIRSGNRTIEAAERFPTLFLVALWFTWLLSSLLDFWGARRASSRMLNIFGAVVLVFTILGNTGSEWTGWAALLLHPLLSVPFFGLAYLAGRRPRLAGFLLLVVSVCFFVFMGFFRRPNMAMITDAVTVILFLGPLAASGVALLSTGKEGTSGDEDDEAPMADERRAPA